ncbi:MAG TPA: hypothetical protein VM450_16450 [Thermomicrobiales bacterium]|nr:hypothetical protein [Thermomicrobiales bacterium]
MNFKSKALGFAATTALSLGIFSGAMAQGSVTATLNDGEAGCNVSATTGSINLGGYTWNGSSYDQTGNAAGSVKADVTSERYDGESCSILAEFSDLTGTNDPTNNKISSTELEVFASNADGGTNPFDIMSGETLDVSASLDGDLSGHAPDTYTGIVTLTVAQGG